MRLFLYLAVATLAAAADLPNFHQVDDRVYRGGQPSKAGFEQLASKGIRTVVDLREPSTRNNWEKSVVESAGMRYVSVPLPNLNAPNEKDTARVLALLDDPSAGPVFVHCRRGKDRTGTIIACYRISHDHWKNEKALNEARSMGLSRMERSMQSYVLHYKVTQ